MRCVATYNNPQTPELITKMRKQIHFYISVKNDFLKNVLSSMKIKKIIKKDNRIITCRLSFSGHKFLLSERLTYMRNTVLDMQKMCSKALSIGTGFFGFCWFFVVCFLFLNTQLNTNIDHHIRRIMGFCPLFCLVILFALVLLLWERRGELSIVYTAFTLTYFSSFICTSFASRSNLFHHISFLQFS